MCIIAIKMPEVRVVNVVGGEILHWSCSWECRIGQNFKRPKVYLFKLQSLASELSLQMFQWHMGFMKSMSQTKHRPSLEGLFQGEISTANASQISQIF